MAIFLLSKLGIKKQIYFLKFVFKFKFWMWEAHSKYAVTECVTIISIMEKCTCESIYKYIHILTPFDGLLAVFYSSNHNSNYCRSKKENIFSNSNSSFHILPHKKIIANMWEP